MINKIIKIDIDILSHFLCCYLNWINIPLLLYLYNINIKYIFDTIGIINLSIFSYLYHRNIYNRLYNKKIEEYYIPDKKNILYFLNDNISIHLRSFFGIITNYYNSKNLFNVLVISAIFHLTSLYCSNINIFKLIIDDGKHKNNFLNYLNAFAIIFDIFLIFINSTKDISIPFLILNIIIGLLFIVDPFYKLTQVAFHILIIIQNYYICLSNIK